MRLALNEIFSIEAKEEIKDDAFDIWLKIKHIEKHKAAPAAFYSRHDIQPGDEYTYISFVDTETGELLFLNCSSILHKAMVHYNLYPEFILNGLNRQI